MADTDRDIQPRIEPIERDGQWIPPSAKTDKLNEVIEQVNRQDRAIQQIAILCVQAQTGWNQLDMQQIFRILDGELKP